MTGDTSDEPRSEQQADEFPDSMQGTITEREDGDGSWYSPPEMTRRNAAKTLIAVSSGAAISSIAVSAVTGLSDAGLAQSGSDELYVKGAHLVDEDGNRLKVGEALPPKSGEKMIVLPQKENGDPLKQKKAVTLLLRFGPDAYEKPTNIDGTAKGYVAYSMVCTHAGCLVSNRLEGKLYCPCHGSQYDPTEGAKVVGGPAPRSLPQLPIGVSKKGELLIATGPFEGPIGPQ